MLTHLLIGLAIAAGLVPTHAAENCTAALQAVGCPTVSGSIGGGSVSLGGSQTTPGTPGRARGGSGGNKPPVSPPKCMVPVGTPCPGVTLAPGTAPVTLSDIASFRPTVPVQHMEPDGWMVVGLDANFYAVAGQQVVDGTLLGSPASVRFTPVAFHWVYGDGQAATRSTKGASWAEQGIHEFDPTPTSHVYQKAGEYTITLVVDFAAEYRFAGSGFIGIAGLLPARANDLHVTVGSAKTVLVEHDCGSDPGGPGC